MSLSEGSTLFIVFSSSMILPSVISSSPAIILNNVDFPQPLGPTKTMNSPFSISREVLSTAFVPFGYILVTSSNFKKLIYFSV